MSPKGTGSFPPTLSSKGTGSFLPILSLLGTGLLIVAKKTNYFIEGGREYEIGRVLKT